MNKAPEKYLVITIFGSGNKAPEIVEICCFVIDGQRLSIVSLRSSAKKISITEEHQFHAYIRPLEFNEETVDNLKKVGVRHQSVEQAEKSFKDVLNEFNTWLYGRKYTDDSTVVVTEWGKAFRDLTSSQCKFSNVEIPWWAKQWICLRREFAAAFDLTEDDKTLDLCKMIDVAKLEYEGKKNSSWDQAFNVASVCSCLLKKGCSFQHKETIVEEAEPL